jgi:hypothetical protein
MRIVNRHPLVSLVKRALIQASQGIHITTSNSFNQWRPNQRRNMATPTKIHLTPADNGVFKFQPQDEEAAAVASRVLQKNHEVMYLTNIVKNLIDK